MFARFGIALGAGLVAGSLVGAVEALYALQAALPAEYQALIYAVLLYGALGAVSGALVGLAMLPFAKLSPGRRWMLAFVSVEVGLGDSVLRAVVERDAFAGQGIPPEVRVAMAAGLLLIGSVTVWIGTNLVTKTPLRALTSFRGTLGLWCAGALLSAVFSAMPAPGAADTRMPDRPQGPEFADRPDIVLILVDGLRADAVGPTLTPALDVFSNDAVSFGQAVAASPSCRPATASLLTSMGMSSHGCARDTCVLNPLVRTLPEVLADAGYLTVGLPNSADISSARGFSQGFDRYAYAPALPLFAAESSASLTWYRRVQRAVAPVATGPVTAAFSPADAQLEAARQELAGFGEKRGLVFVHLREPAGPWFDPRPAYAEEDHPSPTREDKPEVDARYAAAVTATDRAIGAFFAALRKDGRYDDTMIVVTADHGIERLEHDGVWPGSTLYDEVIRVPLLVKLPRGERAGAHAAWQVRQIDVAPTIAAAAGVAPDPTWQGEGLFDERFEEGLDQAVPPEEPAGWTAPSWSIHPLARDAVIETEHEGSSLVALRRGGRKVIEVLAVPMDNPRSQPPVQFYDLVADPGERQNLDGRGLSEEAAMQASLQRLLTQARSRAVGVEGEVLSAEERARRCSLGYLSGADCEPTPP